MNLHYLDTLIVIVCLLATLLSSLYTRRYTRSVADFLSANRCAGRYMLTVASGMAGIGAVSIVALWEKFYQGGFGSLFWGQMMMPIWLILAMSGWIIYRFRQSRAMTVAQFLEMRYSRRFRVFAGALCWVSGVLNYGIFPAVTARFLIYFLGLEVHTWSVPGLDWHVNITLGWVMAAMLGFAVLITISGGQIAVMVSDFVQGQLCNICFLVLMAVVLYLFPWSVIIDTLKHAPAGESKLNPFAQGALPDFNPLLFVMLAILSIYNFMVWQGSQGYNCSALSPHEAKMAGVLGQFRSSVSYMLFPLSAIAAYVLMNGPSFADAAAAVGATLDAISDPQLAKQMTTTLALSHILPIGAKGLLVAVMIMAAVSTDSAYLHSWGSIFVQDVLCPIRQMADKPSLEPERHLRLLRWAIILISVYAWVFSMIFPLQEYIIMYLVVTGAIFTGGAGAVMIGGIYWRRGTTSGAWAALIIGSVLSVAGVVVTNILWPSVLPGLKNAYPQWAWLQSLPTTFWFNGVQMAFIASMSAVVGYVLVSLLSRNPNTDFDKLYHRGPHAIPAATSDSKDAPAPSGRPIPRWMRKLGVTEEFTTGDKVIFALKYAFFLWSFGGFVVLLVANRAMGLMTTEDSWGTWWFINVCVIGVIGTASTVWLLIGGAYDTVRLFRRLRTLQRDATDDGSVTGQVQLPIDIDLNADKPAEGTEALVAVAVPLADTKPRAAT